MAVPSLWTGKFRTGGFSQLAIPSKMNLPRMTVPAASAEAGIARIETANAAKVWESLIFVISPPIKQLIPNNIPDLIPSDRVLQSCVQPEVEVFPDCGV
jgi:hypothetical protein